MELRFLPALVLFLSSYFPLSLILLIQDIEDATWSSSVCSIAQASECVLPQLENAGRSVWILVVCGASLLSLLWLMQSIPFKFQMNVISARPIPNDLINYVFPYVVSFMGLDLGDDGDFYAFLLFIAWLFLITYRSGQVLLNPLLLAMGWQLYEVEASIEGNLRSVKALKCGKLKSGDDLKSCLVQGIYVLDKGSN